MSEGDGLLSPLSVSTPRAGQPADRDPQGECMVRIDLRDVDVGSSSSSDLPPPPGRVQSSRATAPSPSCSIASGSLKGSKRRQLPVHSARSSVRREREREASDVQSGSAVAIAAECALLRGRLEEARRALAREQERRQRDRVLIQELSTENALAVEQIARLRLALGGRPAPDEEACIASVVTHSRRRSRSPSLSRVPRRAARKPPSPSSLPVWELEEVPEPVPARVMTTVKRTLGPPPDASRDAAAVDAAVDLLGQSFAQQGLQLSLTRVGDCAYELCRGKRRRVLNLFLTEDGCLLARTGGGSRPLLDLLRTSTQPRAVLRTSSQPRPVLVKPDVVDKDVVMSFGKLARRCAESIPLAF